MILQLMDYNMYEQAVADRVRTAMEGCGIKDYST